MDRITHQSNAINESNWQKVSREISLLEQSTKQGVQNAVKDVEEHPVKAAAKIAGAAAVCIAVPWLREAPGFLGLATKIGIGATTAAGIKDVATRAGITYDACKATWDDKNKFDQSRNTIAGTVAPFLEDTALFSLGGAAGSGLSRIPAVNSGVNRAYDEIGARLPTFATLQENRLLERLRDYHPSTYEHVYRVKAYTDLLSDEMNLPAGRANVADHAAKMHDVGKLEIPKEVLAKNGELTAAERALMEQHVVDGEQLLNDNVNYPKRLEDVPTIVRGHHAHFDGSGYGIAAAGKDIPLEDRIISVADVFDALHAKRDYKAGMPYGDVMNYLQDNKGKLFDPDIVDAWFRVPPGRVLEIMNREPGANTVANDNEVRAFWDKSA